MNTQTSRKMQIGIKQVARVLSAQNAESVLIALDADSAKIHDIVQMALAQSVPIQYVPTMKALGELCQIDVGAAAAVIIK